MRRLILFRHAKTEARAAGQDDIDRPLTARGRADSTSMGRLAAARGLTPDLVLLSPSVRTRQTWDLAAAAFPATKPEIRDALYEATPEDILAELDAVGADHDAVMVIGHNPSLHELAVNLLLEGEACAADVERISARFPTATIAAFRIDEAGKASLEDVFYPRDTRGEG